MTKMIRHAQVTSICSPSVVILKIILSTCFCLINHIRNENTTNAVNIQQFHRRFRDMDLEKWVVLLNKWYFKHTF